MPRKRSKFSSAWSGTEFQIKRRGEDERFLGSKLRVPKGTLRDRLEDVLGVGAVDAGVDYLFRHGGVTADAVRDLVRGRETIGWVGMHYFGQCIGNRLALGVSVRILPVSDL